MPLILFKLWPKKIFVIFRPKFDIYFYLFAVFPAILFHFIIQHFIFRVLIYF